MDPRHKAEIDRLAELANVGAGQAAGAFAQLVGRTIWMEVPVTVEGDWSAASIAPASGPTNGDPHWCTGVFFEFDGCLDALVGILFPGAASEVLVRRIVGIETGELAAPLIESALMEVGNILASHVASAIADTLRARLLPSIPSLAMEDADSAFSTWVEDRAGPHALRIESGLRDESGELRGRLVLVPTRWSESESSGLANATHEL
ncbi:MAG: chemotaxis protein CheC [Deltaproteobacteria bacterium]|nr:chemotaxis protein CheC [Deltaproteobacteria bacterium]